MNDPRINNRAQLTPGSTLEFDLYLLDEVTHLPIELLNYTRGIAVFTNTKAERIEHVFGFARHPVEGTVHLRIRILPEITAKMDRCSLNFDLEFYRHFELIKIFPISDIIGLNERNVPTPI